ncbi:hypothetical protein QWZ02_12525 [Kinneretia asaccharophila]|nr:hypothetical protein [Roseateles asaccharophilus]
MPLARHQSRWHSSAWALAMVLMMALLPIELRASSAPVDSNTAKSNRVVRIATDDAAAPYSHAVNGRAAGYYLRLVQRAAESMPGWRLEFTPMPWVRALRQAELGEADAVLPPYRGLGREWIAHYVRLPHREEVVLSCHAESGLGANSQWPQDFGGRHIGVTRGYLISPALVDTVQRRWVHKVEFRNARDALAALGAGDIDCYANERLSIEVNYQQARSDPLWANRLPTELKRPLLLSEQQAYLAISRQALRKRPELQEFARDLQVELNRLSESTEMQRLQNELIERP